MPEDVRLESSVTFLPQFYAGPSKTPAPPLDHAYRGRNEVFVEHSSTTRRRTRSGSRRSRRPPASSRRPSGTRRVRSLPPNFFSAPSQAPEHPRDRRVADLQPAAGPTQELAPLGEGGSRARLQVPLQEPPRSLVHLGLGARALLGSQRPPLSGHGGVALDGPGAHVEGPGDLRGGHTLLLGIDDLFPEVQRVGVYRRILPRRPELRCKML
jgi:hypothetical protein